MTGPADSPVDRLRRHLADSDWAGGRALAETLLASHDADPATISLAALVLFRSGAQDRAIAALRDAVRRFPDDAGLAGNLGNALLESGAIAEAVEWQARAAALAPQNATHALNHGHALNANGRRDEAAEAFRRALALDPDNDAARRALAGNLSEAGAIDEARHLFETLYRRRGDAAMDVRGALLLPPILPGLDAIPPIRRRFADSIEALRARRLRIDNPADLGSPSFFLAYHGENEIGLQRRLASFHLELCPALSHVAPHCAEPNRHRSDARLRIGFMSANLRTHTIGRLFGASIGGLDPKRFETILFRRPQAADELSRTIDDSVARVVPLSTQLQEAQRQIAACELDAMFYPDIGMDMATYSLAFARLAPVQCVSWGHPLTTGIPAIDYFVSWAGAEPSDADTHYSERLIRLQSFPTCYRRPVFDPARMKRERFGLPPSATLYLCLQTLFKFHPAFDAALGAILRRDPGGLLLLIDGPRRLWREMLLDRFRRTIPDVVERIRFVPALSNEDYLALTALGNAVLDPPVFGGGNTTLEALAAGRPVISLPGAFLRGRITKGFLEQAGRGAALAKDISDYVERALTAGGASGSGAPPDRDAAAALFGRAETIREHERFFEAAVAAARQGSRLDAWPE